MSANISDSISSYDILPIFNSSSEFTIGHIGDNSSSIPPNTSGTNYSSDDPPISIYTPWQQALVTLALALMVLGTIVGNCLVCIAVGIVKKLQTPSNLLILSLAVSDLLVAVLVMPFVTTYQVLSYWPFGNVICDLFTSLDVILCTASILNLCMISVDRYFVITRPFQYAMKRTPKRMGIMIAGVWCSSVLISLPPLFGWKEDPPKWHCIISQNIGYQIYATLGAFYVPLFVMLAVYYRIWRVSSRLAKKESTNQLGSIDKGQSNAHYSNRVKTNSVETGCTVLPNGNVRNGCHSEKDEDERVEMLAKNSASIQRRRFTIKSILPKGRRSSGHKDSKAIKTLGIIMGGFTACWLPFFILAVIRPFVGDNDIPIHMISVFNWLGYFNSFLNPVIYARFNRDFRTPFKEILCLRCKGINVRIRSESYVEQYGPDPRLRDCLRPPTSSVVRYDSQGRTEVHLGNGSTPSESKV
ncbi:5-hydroxytryptamine receptor 1-like [Mytilus trossulus]|uniref:5-hydroxytryptamine receptor 1-like n=1 Tax=Mytilus trossulus TaxID=6551 RepID=UPI0030068A65